MDFDDEFTRKSTGLKKMNIYVNDQELDATLTNEKNLGDIYSAVNNWISENKRYILGLRVDQEDIAIGDLKKYNTDEVSRFDFYVGDELDMMLTTLEELDHYVDQVGSTLYDMHSIESVDCDNLDDGLSWILQIMESFSGIMKMDISAMNVFDPGCQTDQGVDKILERLELKIKGFRAKNDRDAIEAFLDDLRSFKFFVMKMSLQLKTMNAREDDLIKELGKFEKHIPELVNDIVKINERFNSGKDLEAFEKLEKISEVLNEYLSALFALDYQLRQKNGVDIRAIEINKNSFYDVSREMTELLRDLSRGLEENDIVAAGDILEYELTEKLETLKPYLAEIQELVLARNKT